ncbi:energy-coupling factor transporter transmembrane component T family protein [Salisediminibacterium selenitireducens]|uniref:Energy-coupling factor transporter transmembrane protein EcfT n=1 Tax=Bacillus selenitireducens (strain ATCC 700615 / DSM 15326 / MLS10) TaxID=439292 RepID=ECFT_BACIE|nr:energy-coupling factor transporter transmembrane component T [Salisediminibacterium selenitireducens]D6XVS2.1 RecName: Full=Energy-coupling factor transporter transmembrane protein EcfT; Short=ECF transporter T component EcfT [[Bacillus] selenitireducens MLS10]ADH97695.1 cobalt transport protein [[Bacillus] selenitireducens MLS10]
MFDSIIIGQYVPGDSVVHRLDPRVKLTAVFIFLVFMFMTRDPLLLTVAVLLSFGGLLASRVPLSFYAKGMRFISIIIVLTFVLHLFMTGGGEVIVELPFATIYSGGLIEGFMLAMKLAMIITIASLLTLTTTPIDLTDGMERMLAPFKRVKLPTHELALMMSIALRFIPTLIEETRTIVLAQLARGTNFSEGSLWKRLKALIPILVPLFTQSFKRAEELATAMEARGYAGGEGRTKYRQLHWGLKDSVVLAVFLLFAAAVMAERFMGG